MILPRPSAAQTTQTLSLDEGWNLVSLRVQPDDPSFASIFAGTNGSISSVKNEHGAAYLPSLGIAQISTWQADEGYKVHAETATTIKIIGTDLSPGSVAIALEEGGNIVPYLPDRAQAVEEVVMSIEESLIAVENEDGRRYPSGSTPLDSLRPGQGYKVYVGRADTLQYPVVVETVDDALALQGLDSGTVVEVRGRNEVGDGGGGLFKVVDSGSQTDGATSFIFKEDLSTQQQERTSDLLRGQPGYDLPATDLAWTEVEVEYGPDPGQYLTALQLHGHRGTADYVGALNTKDGIIGGSGMLNSQKRLWGGGDDYDYRIRYKYATSTRRLERQNVTNSFNIDWWGGTTRVSEGWTQEWWNADVSVMEFAPTDDNTAQIAWATNRAQRAVDNNSDISTAYVDFPGMYWQLFKVWQPDNVIHRGIGPERTVGNATVKGGVKLPPNLAMWHAIESGSNSYLGSQITRWENARTHLWGYSHGHFPMENEVGFKNFDLHGNRANNQQVFDSGNYGDIKNKIQNGSMWTGWRTSKKGQETNGTGRGYVEGLHLFLNNAAIRQMGGNGVNTADGSIILDTNNYFAGSSQRNHSIYGFAGPGTDEPALAENIQHSGFSWAVPIKLGTWKDYNFNFNTLKNLDRRGENAQWGATYKNIIVNNLERNEVNGYNYTQIFNIEKGNVDINGYEIEFKGAPRGFLVFANNFTGQEITDGKLDIGSESGRLIRSFTDNIRTFLNDEITLVDGLTVNGTGDFILVDRKDERNTNVKFRNINIEAPARGGQENGYALGASTEPLKTKSRPRGSTPGAKRLTFDNVDWNGGVNKIARFSYSTDSNGNQEAQDFFVTNSSINNIGDWSVFYPKQSQASKAGRHDRIYMSNTTINIPLSSLEYQDQFHHALSPNSTVVRNTPAGDWVVDGGPQIRLRGCTTPNGRVSDSVGNTFTSTASDEGNDFVLIPTSLLGRPFEINTTLASSPSGISSITSVEIANSDGSLRSDQTQLEHDPYLKVNLDGTIGSGETVTVDWTARVTPLDQYRTTGLFISRPVPNKTFTSGNGPFTVDLRGVAASQETWTPPEYTASSSDTGVVTATVTETKHRANYRAYTLELTEQGTGTATITIDANIPDVGTATTTFEVTVE